MLVNATGVGAQARLFVQAASDGSFIFGYAQSKAHIYNNATTSLPIVPAYNASFMNTQCQGAGTTVELTWYNTTVGVPYKPKVTYGSAACSAGRFTVQVPPMSTDIAFTATVRPMNSSLPEEKRQHTGLTPMVASVRATS